MPVIAEPCTKDVCWPCREAERVHAARAVAAPAADAGAPKAKAAQRDPSQPRKIGPVYVHIPDQVPARRASGEDACAAFGEHLDPSLDVQLLVPGPAVMYMM